MILQNQRFGLRKGKVPRLEWGHLRAGQVKAIQLGFYSSHKNNRVIFDQSATMKSFFFKREKLFQKKGGKVFT